MEHKLLSFKKQFFADQEAILKKIIDS